MKLVIAIMEEGDSAAVSGELSRVGYLSTTTSCVGGFIRKPRDMVMIGVDDMRVRDVLGIVEQFTHHHPQGEPQPGTGGYAGQSTGGAAVFVLDVDQHLRL